MNVFVEDTGVNYQLIGGILDANWRDVESDHSTQLLAKAPAGGIHFRGTDNRIYLPDLPESIDTGASVAFYLREPTTEQGGTQSGGIYFSFSGDGSAPLVLFTRTAGTQNDYRFGVTPDTGTPLTTLIPGQRTGKWQHICITISSTALRCYIDGVVAAEHTGTFSLSATKATFGGLNNSVVNAHRGPYSLRGAMLFNRELAASEVGSIMTTGTVPFGDRHHWGQQLGKYTTTADLSRFDKLRCTLSLVTIAGRSNIIEVTKTSTLAAHVVFLDSPLVAVSGSYFSSALDVHDPDNVVVNLGWSTVFAEGFNFGEPHLATNTVVDGWRQMRQAAAVRRNIANPNRPPSLISVDFNTSAPVGSVMYIDPASFRFTLFGCLASYPMADGVGTQIRDESASARHVQAPADIMHLLPQTKGAITRKGTNVSTTGLWLSADDILPANAVVTEIIADGKVITPADEQVITRRRIHIENLANTLVFSRTSTIDAGPGLAMGSIAVTSAASCNITINYQIV